MILAPKPGRILPSRRRNSDDNPRHTVIVNLCKIPGTAFSRPPAQVPTRRRGWPMFAQRTWIEKAVGPWSAQIRFHNGAFSFNTHAACQNPNSCGPTLLEEFSNPGSPAEDRKLDRRGYSWDIFPAEGRASPVGADGFGLRVVQPTAEVDRPRQLYDQGENQ